MHRKVDLLLSLSALSVTAPLMLVVAVLIKMTSNGPVLYKQERVGLKGKCFKIYKFRSMVRDAEKHTGPVWAIKNDGRVTFMGKVLRKTRLDELPQLINVLKGDMALVGPRPERPHFVKLHKVLQGGRLSVKPGLTGLAQIEAYYHTSPRNKIRYDYLYIKNKSVFLDLKILLKTMIIIFTRPGT